MRPFCTGSIVLAIFRTGIRVGLDEFDFPYAIFRPASCCR